MKKQILMLAGFFAILTGLRAQERTISTSRDDSHFTVNINDESGKLYLTVKGIVTLTSDDKAIKTISADGSVAYQKGDQTLDIVGDRDGRPLYTVNNVKKTDPNAGDRALIEDCVQRMIDYGIDAPNRAKRIFSEKGTTGILNEIDRFKGDYVKEIYFSWLLKNQQLSQQEMIGLLNKTDQYLVSDYYKANLMDGVMPSFLGNEATSDAYLTAVSHMGSDFYQYNTIRKLLDARINEKQFDKVLLIVDNMKSAYYQSQVLNALLKDNSLSDSKFSSVMKIASNMNGDYYKAGIISLLLGSKTLSNDRYTQTIAAMKNIKSDYYQSEILKQLIDEDMKDETTWSQLIRYAGDINSDFYRSDLLIKIAGKMPKNDLLKRELKDAAKKVKSDIYYGKLMRAIEGA